MFGYRKLSEMKGMVGNYVEMHDRCTGMLGYLSVWFGPAPYAGFELPSLNRPSLDRELLVRN